MNSSFIIKLKIKYTMNKLKQFFNLFKDGDGATRTHGAKDGGGVTKTSGLKMGVGLTKSSRYIEIFW